MGVSKVDFAGNTLVDLTGDSVTPETLLKGATAHNAAGDRIEGNVTVPTKTSELTNDSGYITSSQAPVQSVNGKTGNVTVSTTFVAYRLGNSEATCTFAEMLEAWKRGDICILRYGADGMLEYQLFAVVDNESITFTYVDGDIIREIVWTADGNFTDNNKGLAKELPTVTTADNGKFLRVVSGAWAAVEIANANGGSF